MSELLTELFQLRYASGTVACHSPLPSGSSSEDIVVVVVVVLLLMLFRNDEQWHNQHE